MPVIEVRDMTPDDEAYVGSSSRETESSVLDAAGQRRVRWLHAMESKGLKIKVALLDGEHAGVAYVLPIEICPWCATGKDLMALPCLYVHHQPESHGVGTVLIRAAEEEARNQGRKGMVIVAYREDFWAVSPAFFQEQGYRGVAHHGRQVVMWKRFADDAVAPKAIKRRFKFEPVKGKVVIDLFHNTLCRPSVVEAIRVRDLAERFGTKVLLREHSADERKALVQHGIPRAIFINGREVSWGHAAPDDALAQEISREILRVSLR
ncbi:MAG: GNAT family N-acetyltransferase [candidate division WOR-3 bacterium]|nr:MAG: GNAT family N-acetyltransferase [candidate division WOR-3 bacterium]